MSYREIFYRDEELVEERKKKKLHSVFYLMNLPLASDSPLNKIDNYFFDQQQVLESIN